MPHLLPHYTDSSEYKSDSCIFVKYVYKNIGLFYIRSKCLKTIKESPKFELVLSIINKSKFKHELFNSSNKTSSIAF